MEQMVGGGGEDEDSHVTKYINEVKELSEDDSLKLLQNSMGV